MMHLKWKLKLTKDITFPFGFFLVVAFTISTSFQVTVAYQDQVTESQCRTETTGCGSCLKVHKDCGWCSDPNSDVEFRCDTSENLKERCPKYLVHQPESKVEVVQDNPLGSSSPYTSLPIQMQPQHLQLTMRPGVTLTFQIKYVHVDQDVEQVYILNSDAETQGLTFKVNSNCPESQISGDDPRSCNNVKPNDILQYNVSLTLMDCVTSGDAVLSVGIGGLREVVAVYVTPSCGCDCEKFEFHEQRSPTCNHHGTLICGRCMCNTNRQGSFCEHDAHHHHHHQQHHHRHHQPTESAHKHHHQHHHHPHVAHTSEMQTTHYQPTSSAPVVRDDCRLNQSHPDCSGQGTCTYGECKCHVTATARYYGRYCECDAESCPRYRGIMCNGHGACDCGRCICNDGWTDPGCTCSPSVDNCRASTGEICYSAGICICNICKCSKRDDGSSISLSAQCEPITTTTVTMPETEPQTTTSAATTTMSAPEPMMPIDIDEETEMQTVQVMETTTKMTTILETTTEAQVTNMQMITSTMKEETMEKATTTMMMMKTPTPTTMIMPKSGQDTTSGSTQMAHDDNDNNIIGSRLGPRLKDDRPHVKATVSEKRIQDSPIRDVGGAGSKPSSSGGCAKLINTFSFLSSILLLSSIYFYL